MHENTREWHSCHSLTPQTRINKRPLSVGDHELNSGPIATRNRSKTIHSTHETVRRYQGLTDCPIDSNNSYNNNNNNYNNISINNNIFNNNNECNESTFSQNSFNSSNYLFHNFNDCTPNANFDHHLITTSSTTSSTDAIDYGFMRTTSGVTFGEYLPSSSIQTNICPIVRPFSHPRNPKSMTNAIAFRAETQTSRPLMSSFNRNHTYSGVELSQHNIESNNIKSDESVAKTDSNEKFNEMPSHYSRTQIKSPNILKQLLITKAITNQSIQTSNPLNPIETNANNSLHSIPTQAEKAQFRRSLDSATNLVFHRRNGLPLTSSPAPMRKSGTCFDFDSSLTSVNAIKKALFEKDPDIETEITFQPVSQLSTSAPPSTTISSLLGNFEESVLNGRLDPVSTVHGFTAEMGASGSFCPRHKTYPVTVFFYTLQDSDKVDRVSSPYLGHINLGKKGYHIPRKGTVQVTLFNPHGTVVKMFVVRYDLSDMPPNSKTFLRQRTLFMPSDAHETDADNRKWLRYLIHLRVESSKSGRIYLHTDVRIIVFRKHDLDVATINGLRPYELRSFTQCPVNPKYS